MTILSTPELASFLLSREELILLLELLQTDYILGLDEEPLGKLVPEQEALVLVSAERALRAREYARIDANGRLVVRESVLMGVGVCAYAQQSVLIHYFPAAGDSRRFFGHRRGDNIVAHTMPDATLHLFSPVADSVALMEQLLDFCDSATLPRPHGTMIVLDGATLSNAREMAQKDVEASANIFVSGGAPVETARSLAKTLGGPHNISVIQFLSQHTADSVAKRELTLFKNSYSAWLMVQSESDQANGTYTLSPVTTEGLKSSLHTLWSGNASMQ